MSAKNPAAYIQVNPALDESRAKIGKFARDLDDLSPFWRALGENLADTTQARWPLRRKTGRLRTSLEWTGQRLGRGGIYRSAPSRLTFGSSVFYAGFLHHGTKHQPARALIHVDGADIGHRLTAWARERAVTAGLEVE